MAWGASVAAAVLGWASHSYADEPIVDASDPALSTPPIGLAPEVAPPITDLVAASLRLSETGARITATITPFRLALRSDVAVLSDTALQLRTDTGAGTWGGALTLGYSSARRRFFSAAEDAADCLGQASEARTRMAAELGVTLVPGEVTTESQILLAAPNAAEQSQRAARLERIADEAATCISRRYDTNASRLFQSAFSINFSFATDFFAYVDEPPVMTGTPEAPMLLDRTAEMLAGWSVSASGAYFPESTVSMWLTAAYSQRRPSPEPSALDSRLSFSLTAAVLVPFAPPTPQGFRPGLAIGAIGGWAICTSATPCREALKSSYATPVSITDILTFGFFIDLRIDTRLQLRTAFTVDRLVLLEGPTDTMAVRGDDIWRVTPSLSLTTSSWSL